MARITHSRATSGDAGARSRFASRLKHKPYKILLESVTQEKQKLISLDSYNVQPPKNYTFLPSGTPELTERCKELSRTRELAVYVVSVAPKKLAPRNPGTISHHIHRIGCHFRSDIVAEACRWLGFEPAGHIRRKDVNGEIIVTSHLAKALENNGRRLGLQGATQSTQQIKDSIRDLFPEIPDKDLNAIVGHAFKEGSKTVGNALEIPLANRVQLATLAHIRHTHTDYDKFLKIMPRQEARACIEHACMRQLMTWRGEDANGAVELEEIFREFIVIDDDEQSTEVESEYDQGPMIDDEGDPQPSHELKSVGFGIRNGAYADEGNAAKRLKVESGLNDAGHLHSRPYDYQFAMEMRVPSSMKDKAGISGDIEVVDLTSSPDYTRNYRPVPGYRPFERSMDVTSLNETMQPRRTHLDARTTPVLVPDLKRPRNAPSWKEPDGMNAYHQSGHSNKNGQSILRFNDFGLPHGAAAGLGDRHSSSYSERSRPPPMARLSGGTYSCPSRTFEKDEYVDRAPSRGACTPHQIAKGAITPSAYFLSAEHRVLEASYTESSQQPVFQSERQPQTWGAWETHMFSEARTDQPAFVTQMPPSVGVTTFERPNPDSIRRRPVYIDLTTPPSDATIREGFMQRPFQDEPFAQRDSGEVESYDRTEAYDTKQVLYSNSSFGELCSRPVDSKPIAADGGAPASASGHGACYYFRRFLGRSRP